MKILYNLVMKFSLYRAFCYNKNGTMNYERASKWFGLSPSDLRFWNKGHFSLIDTPTLMSGVFVCYRPTSKNPMFYAPWVQKTCFHSNDDLNYIYRLVNRPGFVPDWATYDYFIMDSTGRVLFRNFEFDKSIDENGVIHLSSPEHDLDDLVYPAEGKKYAYKHQFCYGRGFKELNNHVRMMADAKVIRTPKHFKKGFEQVEEAERK